MLYRLKPVNRKTKGSPNCGELLCFNATRLSGCKEGLTWMKQRKWRCGEQQVHGHSRAHRGISSTGRGVEAQYRIFKLRCWKYRAVRNLNKPLESYGSSRDCLEMNLCASMHSVSHLLWHISWKVHALIKMDSRLCPASLELSASFSFRTTRYVICG